MSCDGNHLSERCPKNRTYNTIFGQVKKGQLNRVREVAGLNWDPLSRLQAHHTMSLDPNWKTNIDKPFVNWIQNKELVEDYKLAMTVDPKYSTWYATPGLAPITIKKEGDFLYQRYRLQAWRLVIPNGFISSGNSI